MQRFTELKVWRRSHALTLRIYRLTKRFPADERYGLTSQLRRAAISVPTNLVEGSKRLHNSDFARFLNISEASLAETEYLLLLSRDLAFIDATMVKPLVDECAAIAGMLHRLRLRVEAAT